VSSLLPDAIVDLTEVDESLADMETRAKRLAPAFRALRKPLRGDQRDHAKKAEAPDGAWAPRAAATEERRRSRNRRARASKALRTISLRKRRGGSPKSLLGRLPRALRITVGPLFIRATSRAGWGGSHNQGDRVGHRRRVKLPRRTFVWLSDALLSKASETLAEYIVKGRA
jgi:hypothetical protein